MPIARAILNVTDPGTPSSDAPTGSPDSVSTHDIIEIPTRLNLDGWTAI